MTWTPDSEQYSVFERARLSTYLFEHQIAALGLAAMLIYPMSA